MEIHAPYSEYQFTVSPWILNSLKFQNSSKIFTHLYQKHSKSSSSSLNRASIQHIFYSLKWASTEKKTFFSIVNEARNKREFFVLHLLQFIWVFFYIVETGFLWFLFILLFFALLSFSVQRPRTMEAMSKWRQKKIFFTSHWMFFFLHFENRFFSNFSSCFSFEKFFLGSL